eukprot:scaffold13585_cov84-Phaeocystis_antarctica.AAC.1
MAPSASTPPSWQWSLSVYSEPPMLKRCTAAARAGAAGLAAATEVAARAASTAAAKGGSSTAGRSPCSRCRTRKCFRCCRLPRLGRTCSLTTRLRRRTREPGRCRNTAWVAASKEAAAAAAAAA